MRRLIYCCVLLVFALPLYAETAPCGIAVVRAEGPKIDERFVAAPPDQVKTAVLKALPAVAMKVHKDKGFKIEAKTDQGLLQSLEQKNHDAGVHGAMAGIAFGSMKIEIHEAKQDETAGSRLRIQFEKPAILGRAVNHGNDAMPLAEETVCLVKILSDNDPVANPRGLPLPKEALKREVSLPEGTPLKIQLRDWLDSKNLRKHEEDTPATGERQIVKGEGQDAKGVGQTTNGDRQTTTSVGQTIQFEVAEDVVVNNAIVVRRGALATGHFTNVEQAKGYGRNAEIDFAFDTVTTVDGQSVPLTAAGEKAKGGRHDQIAQAIFTSPALGWLMRGADTVIRAGTSYEVETSGEHTIQAGH